MSDPTSVVGQRVGAFLIDSILLSIVNFAVFFALAEKTSEIAVKEGPDTTVYGNVDIGDEQYSLYGGKFLVYLLIIAVVWFLYWVVLPALKGWTLGKLATGIRVVDEQGRVPSGIGRNFVRQLLWVVDSFPWLIPYLTGFILALVTKGHRRLGDMAAKTFVVRASAVGQPPLAPALAGGYGQPAAPFQQPPAFQQPPQPAIQPPPDAQPPQQPEGWYPDPHGQARLRYWDGSAWTQHTSA